MIPLETAVADENTTTMRNEIYLKFIKIIKIVRATATCL